MTDTKDRLTPEELQDLADLSLKLLEFAVADLKANLKGATDRYVASVCECAIAMTRQASPLVHPGRDDAEASALLLARFTAALDSISPAALGALAAILQERERAKRIELMPKPSDGSPPSG